MLMSIENYMIGQIFIFHNGRQHEPLAMDSFYFRMSQELAEELLLLQSLCHKVCRE